MGSRTHPDEVETAEIRNPNLTVFAIRRRARKFRNRAKFNQAETDRRCQFMFSAKGALSFLKLGPTPQGDFEYLLSKRCRRDSNAREHSHALGIYRNANLTRACSA